MPHVLVAGKIHAKGLALLENAPGVTMRYIEEISVESFAPYMAEADALLIRTQPLMEKTVALGERLKIVSRHGVGFDSVEVPALTARGIALAVCGDVNSTSVAEHACMMILAASKRALRADRSVRDGPWGWRNTMESQDLRGRVLLILGFGRIGQHTARMMAGFGMEIRAFDPWLAAQGWPEGPVRPVTDLKAALAEADVVSVSAPKGERPLLGAEELAAVKQGAVIVNTARGGIVDEAALVAALERGQVGAAGLDVFDDEPPAPDHPLKRFDQVLLSPHIAGVTEGASERMATGAAQNILDFFAGRLDAALVVNRADL